MTNEQLYIAIGVPLIFNATLFGVLLLYINAKFEAVDRRFVAVDQRFESVDRRFESIDRRFDSLNQRFEDLKELWRAKLHRVEEILDARLKHLEERR